MHSSKGIEFTPAKQFFENNCGLALVIAPALMAKLRPFNGAQR